MKKTDFIGIRVSQQVKTILQNYADEKDRSLSYVANKALEEYARKITTKPPVKNPPTSPT